MTKKHIIDFIILSNEKAAEGYHLLILRPDALQTLPEMHPGQFVEIRVPDSANTFLRRPISINFVQGNQLWLMIKDAGEGTHHLCEMQRGEILNIILPLGNGFSLETGNDVLLVGGGVGAAPLLYLAAKLKEQGKNVRILIGARKQADLTQISDFEKYGTVGITTEDGSAGTKGFVTDHAWLRNLSTGVIKCCGPLPMMKAVAAVAKKAGVNCEVSLENKMACGVGACLCCVEDTVHGNECVCTAGPVFDINHLKW